MSSSSDNFKLELEYYLFNLQELKDIIKFYEEKSSACFPWYKNSVLPTAYLVIEDVVCVCVWKKYNMTPQQREKLLLNGFEILRNSVPEDEVWTPYPSQSDNHTPKCRICKKNPPQVMFLPCGHFVCCIECHWTIKVCIICEKTLYASVRVQQ